MHKIKSLSKAQNEWLKSYQGATGFEPMHLDEVESGEMSFNEAAKRNIDWYEDHMRDAYNAISTHVPFDEFIPITDDEEPVACNCGDESRDV